MISPGLLEHFNQFSFFLSSVGRKSRAQLISWYHPGTTTECHLVSVASKPAHRSSRAYISVQVFSKVYSVVVLLHPLEYNRPHDCGLQHQVSFRYGIFLSCAYISVDVSSKVYTVVLSLHPLEHNRPHDCGRQHQVSFRYGIFLSCAYISVQLFREGTLLYFLCTHQNTTGLVIVVCNIRFH